MTARADAAGRVADGRKKESIKERLLRELRRLPNEHVTTSELSLRTGLTRDQVTSSMHAMRRSMGPFVRRVGDGVWLYTPTPKGIDPGNPDRPLYEEVGTTEDGKRVVRGPQGMLWEITPLKVT